VSQRLEAVNEAEQRWRRGTVWPWRSTQHSVPLVRAPFHVQASEIAKGVILTVVRLGNTVPSRKRVRASDCLAENRCHPRAAIPRDS
jgi:hypothetical protein